MVRSTDAIARCKSAVMGYSFPIEHSEDRSLAQMRYDYVIRILKL